VLKLWFPDVQHGFERESDALQLYEGHGSIKLLQIDVERRAMLLERAEPGRDLWQLEDDNERIEVAAGLMQRLWRLPPPLHSLPGAAAEIERLAERAPHIAPPDFPFHWVTRAQAMFRDIEASYASVVLHGDLHHTNILSAEREPWLAIDPHGLVGPSVYEPIQFILNVVWRDQDHVERRKTITRYVDAFSDALKLGRDAVRACGVVRTVIEALWTLEDHGTGWEKDIALVEDFAAPPKSGSRR
jgi:streptomycin 6-kinase